MWQGFRADREVFRHHAQILVPPLVIAHFLPIQLLESESGDIVSQLVFGEYFGRFFDSVVLVFNDTHNHAAEDEIGLAGVRVRLCQSSISQRVVAVVKFGYVSPKVFTDRELTPRMYPLIAIRPQN